MYREEAEGMLAEAEELERRGELEKAEVLRGELLTQLKRLEKESDKVEIDSFFTDLPF